MIQIRHPLGSKDSRFGIEKIDLKTAIQGSATAIFGALIRGPRMVRMNVSNKRLNNRNASPFYLDIWFRNKLGCHELMAFLQVIQGQLLWKFSKN